MKISFAKMVGPSDIWYGDARLYKREDDGFVVVSTVGRGAGVETAVFATDEEGVPALPFPENVISSADYVKALTGAGYEVVEALSA